MLICQLYSYMPSYIVHDNFDFSRVYQKWAYESGVRNSNRILRDRNSGRQWCKIYLPPMPREQSKPKGRRVHN